MYLCEPENSADDTLRQKLRNCMSYSRKKFYDYCRETSAHGLNHINENRSTPLKIIWGCVFIVCLVMTIAGFIDTAVKYAANPMAIDQQIMPNTSVLFPRIDICTRNRFEGQRVVALNISEKLIRQIDAAYFGAYDERLFSRISNESKEELETLMSALNVSEFGELLVRLIPSCLDILEYSYGGDSHRWQNCDTLPIQRFLWPDGACFSIDGIRSKAANVGIQLWMKFPLSEEKYMHADNVDPYVGYTLDSLDTVVTRLHPGRFYQIYFKLRTIQTVNKPPNQICIEAPNYDIVRCRLECAQHLVKLGLEEDKVCGCQPAREATRKLFNNTRLPNETLPICDPWQLIDCYIQRKHFPPATFDQIAYEDCKTKCIYPCSTNIYDFRVIQSELDMDIIPFRYDYNKTFIRHRMSRSIVDLRVELVHDHYILVRQYETMSIGTVFSFFGGQLGLFLGCSILTVIHTLLFCGQAVVEQVSLFKKRRGNEHWAENVAMSQNGYMSATRVGDLRPAPPPYPLSTAPFFADRAALLSPRPREPPQQYFAFQELASHNV